MSERLVVYRCGLEVKIDNEAMVIARKKTRRRTRSTTNDTFFHSNSFSDAASVFTNLCSNLSMEQDNRKRMASNDAGFGGRRAAAVEDTV
jgi:hypothetical protein